MRHGIGQGAARSSLLSGVEKEERVHHSGVGRDLKVGVLKCRGCKIDELFLNVDEYVHCDLSAVGLELGN